MGGHWLGVERHVCPGFGVEKEETGVREVWVGWKYSRVKAWQFQGCDNRLERRGDCIASVSSPVPRNRHFAIPLFIVLSTLHAVNLGYL